MKSPWPAGEVVVYPGRVGGQEPSVGQAAAPPPGDFSEEALVEGARALEDNAWATIYERHYRQVYAYAYHRVGNREAAEDLASEVFTRAVAGIRSYRYRGRPLLAWLYRIAHNLTSDYLSRRHRWSDTADEEVATVDPELEGVPLRQDLLQALRGLSREQQHVVILRFFQGFTNVEVGAILGKNEGAVRALQCRALASLRRRLSAPMGPGGAVIRG